MDELPFKVSEDGSLEAAFAHLAEAQTYCRRRQDEYPADALHLTGPGVDMREFK